MFRRHWGNDRRRFQRLSVNLSVFYRVRSPLHVRIMVDDQEIEAITVDLCEGGMALLTDYNIPAQTILMMKFILFKLDRGVLVSFNDPVEVKAEVCSNIPVQEERYRLGISFMQAEKENRSKISRYVESSLKPA